LFSIVFEFENGKIRRLYVYADEDFSGADRDRGLINLECFTISGGADADLPMDLSTVVISARHEQSSQIYRR
jgi:hypothetical protein